MTKVPPEPTPTPARVCPECGKVPDAARTRTDSQHRASACARRVILALALMIAAWTGLHPHPGVVSVAEPLSNGVRTQITLEALRDMVDGRTSPRGLRDSILAQPDKVTYGTDFDFDGVYIRVTKGELSRVSHDRWLAFGFPVAFLVVSDNSERLIGRTSPRWTVDWECIGYGDASASAWLRINAFAMLLALVFLMNAIVRRCTSRNRVRAGCVGLSMLVLAWPTSQVRTDFGAGPLIQPATPLPIGEWGYAVPNSEEDARMLARALLRDCDHLDAQLLERFDAPLELNLDSTSILRHDYTAFGRPFPFAMLSKLTTAGFPRRELGFALFGWNAVLQLPNAENATTRRVFTLNIPAAVALVLLLVSLYHVIRHARTVILYRRLRHRQNRNLCPHCAYPIPTPPTT